MSCARRAVAPFVVSLALVGVTLAGSSPSLAHAQRAGYGSNTASRGSLIQRFSAWNAGRRGNTPASPLRRDPSSLLRRSSVSVTATPTSTNPRIRTQQSTILRSTRVLADPHASTTQLRAAGEEASSAFHAIGEALEEQGDHAGAATAFSNAAASRWGRNDGDQRFRSQAWARAARVQVNVGDRQAAAESLRRAAESLDRLGGEGDQLEAAHLYEQEAAMHAELGDTRGQAEALVGQAEALTRAGNIVADSYQRFDRGAPSTWPESEHVLRARANDHFVAASRLRDTARATFRELGMGRWASRRAVNNPRSQLPDPPITPSPEAAP